MLGRTPTQEITNTVIMSFVKLIFIVSMLNDETNEGLVIKLKDLIN